MNRYFAASAAFAFLSSVIVAASGCSSPSSEQIGDQEGAQTPGSPQGMFALADTCSRLFQRHAAVHDLDLQVGTIRWGCGDVPGVTDPDLGQEYCEYKAVQGGKIVQKPSEIVSGGGQVSCVFTSVFKDASGVSDQLEQAMADTANLGTAATAAGIVQMQQGFNSRSAATGLVSDCSRSPGASTLLTRQRTAACYLAVQAGGANAAQLTTLCKGDLEKPSGAWSKVAALGVSVKNAGDTGYEPQQDLASCMQVSTAGGVAWRNSDPMICSRTERTTSECSCAFSEVPSTLNGFEFTGWVDDHIPSTCRLAKVDNADYPYITICDVSDQQVSDLPLNPAYSRSMQNFCHDAFGKDLVLKLPLRALAQPGSCQQSAAFCSEYMGGSAAPSTDGISSGSDGSGTATRAVGAPPAPPVDSSAPSTDGTGQ